MYVNIRDSFEKLMVEHMDYKDKETRVTLLAMNENEQSSAIQSLTVKLYENIVDKVDDIDFGEIPMSKGDIDKFEQTPKIEQCLRIMSDLITEYKQSTGVIDIVRDSIVNLRHHKELFTRAFLYKSEVPIVFYDTIVLSIVSATSLLIATCVDYIKQPGTDDYALVFDKVQAVRTKSSLLFDNLVKFNESCKNGTIKKSFEALIDSNRKGFLGGMEIGMVAMVGATIAIAFNIIPIMRELIFFFYFTKMRMSRFCELQADLLTINANTIEQKDITTDAKVSDVRKKQLKVAEKFRKAATALEVTAKTSEKETNKEIKKQDKKYKVHDIVDTAPSNTTSNTSNDALF